MGFSHVLRLCLQGGGVYISSGTVSFSSCTITGNTAAYVRAHAQNFPSPRCDFQCFALCLQGGGVYIYSGTVIFSSCTITGNTATYVRALTLKISHRPGGENADALALILACTTANNASINTVGTRHRDLKISHGPNGIFTCFALVLAGRRCFHQ